jgi:hypothetical protein
MKDTDLAWAAGFIDADGALTLNKHYRSKHTGEIFYSVNVVMDLRGDSKNQLILNKLQKMFGGAIRGPFEHTMSYTNKKFLKIRWHIMAQKAYNCINLIYPYLLLKKEQAKIIKNYYERILERKKHKIRKIKSTEIEYRHNAYLEMKELNKRGITDIIQGSSFTSLVS